MADEMSDCPPISASAVADGGKSVSTATSAATQLPTLQRNALRKIVDRHEFTPEEVAMLGYRRLQQAEGIGNKGQAAIAEWLRRYGFDLKPPDVAANPQQSLPKRMRRTIESAVVCCEPKAMSCRGVEIRPRETREQGRYSFGRFTLAIAGYSKFALAF